VSANPHSFRHGRRNPATPRTRARWRAATSLAVLVGALIGGPSLLDATLTRGARASTGSTPRVEEVSARELRVLELAVNRHRVAIGCKPLIWDERLAGLARKYSQTMATKGYFGHIDPSGDDPFDRMRNAGIRFRAAGENLAAGQTRGRQVYDDWMKSRHHRDVIEDCVYTHYGIGFYRYRWSYLCARY
jgi:uncharacterized protein YkwD